MDEQKKQNLTLKKKSKKGKGKEGGNTKDWDKACWEYSSKQVSNQSLLMQRVWQMMIEKRNSKMSLNQQATQKRRQKLTNLTSEDL